MTKQHIVVYNISMNNILRPTYLAKLNQFRDVKIIKVITGVRRAGKSTLLDMYRSSLVASDIDENCIQKINLEDARNEPLLEWHALHDHIMSQLVPNKRNYIFIDEIQNVPEFEKAVDSLFIQDNVDLYITGSNAYFLSSEIATILTGRYIEIKVYPLSFTEYVSAFPDQPRMDVLFERYKTHGSLPQTVEIDKIGGQAAVQTYLQGVYSTLIHTDIVARLGVEDFKLDKVVRFVFDNIGNITSPQKIVNAIKSDGYEISRNTVEAYLQALVEGFVLYQADRFDIRGKEILKTLGKYYLVDLGLRNLLIHKEVDDAGHILENIVYFELLRRSESVWIGKNESKEIDFVVKTTASGIEYYQVAETMQGVETRQRELQAFNNITDNYPKYILTSDPGNHLYNGIQQVNVIDWLLER